VRKLSVLFCYLSLFGLLTILIGWYFFQWPTTTSIPYFIVSLVLFIQSLAVTQTIGRNFQRVNGSLFCLQLVIASGYFFSLFTISNCWKFMLIVNILAIYITYYSHLLTAINTKKIKLLAGFYSVFAIAILLYSVFVSHQFAFNYLILIAGGIAVIISKFTKTTKVIL
jgi:hypothetical protein